MDENLNKTEKTSDQTGHHHHSSGRHHHHSSDGSSSEHHHHHHHHHHSSSGVKVVTGRDARKLPWKDGLLLILVSIIMFLILVLCTRFI